MTATLTTWLQPSYGRMVTLFKVPKIHRQPMIYCNPNNSISSYQFAQELRRTDPSIPIHFITARDDIASKEKGFNSGIDDYMVKPINFNELLLRIKALLRRAKITADNLLIVGNLTLNNEAITAQVNHQTVDVTVREFQILYKLLSYPDHAFSRAELINEFWDLASDTSMRAVDVYITKLREKFKAADGFTIKTIHGLGYKAVLTLWNQ